MKFLRNLLNGAFPPQKPEEVPPEQQHVPADGLIKAPKTFDIDFGPDQFDATFPPIGTVLVEVGAFVVAGHPIAEIETSSHIIEIPSPCNAVIEQLYIESGDAIDPDQTIAKIRAAGEVSVDA